MEHWERSAAFHVAFHVVQAGMASVCFFGVAAGTSRTIVFSFYMRWHCERMAVVVCIFGPEDRGCGGRERKGVPSGHGRPADRYRRRSCLKIWGKEHSCGSNLPEGCQTRIDESSLRFAFRLRRHPPSTELVVERRRVGRVRADGSFDFSGDELVDGSICIFLIRFIIHFGSDRTLIYQWSSQLPAALA